MAEEIQEETGAAPVANKGKRKLIIIVAAALAVIGIAAGAVLFLLPGEAPELAEDGTPVPVAPVLAQGPVQYLDLSPSFLVNFPYQGRQRFLQASLSVMGRDPVAMQAIIDHMPVIRHNLINLFNAQLLLVFEDPSGIEQLRTLATEEVNLVLTREIGRPGIEEVLFTTFVLQ